MSEHYQNPETKDFERQVALLKELHRQQHERLESTDLAARIRMNGLAKMVENNTNDYDVLYNPGVQLRLRRIGSAAFPRARLRFLLDNPGLEDPKGFMIDLDHPDGSLMQGVTREEYGLAQTLLYELEDLRQTTLPNLSPDCLVILPQPVDLANFQDIS